MPKSVHTIMRYPVVGSLLTAKLTNLLKSLILDGSLFPSPLPATSADGGGGLLIPPVNPRDANVVAFPWPFEDDPVPSRPGNDTRFPVGLMVDCTDNDPGSISRDDKNDVLSSSSFVLVMVRNESRRLFCSARGVPLRSKTCVKGQENITN